MMDIKKTIEQAQCTALTKEGISSLATELTLSESELADIVAILCKQSDGHAIAAILLAFAVSGRKLPPETVGSVLGIIPSIEDFVAIVGSCKGDVAGMFLAAVESGRMSNEREVLSLWYTAGLLQEEPPDERLVAALGAKCRLRLNIESGC